MQYLAFLLICWGTVGAKKEDYEGLEELMNNPSLLSELEKRLGALLEENGLNSESATEELPCNATSGPLDTVQAACDFKSDDNVIIKTTDSLNNGAYFVKRMENVLCAKDCASECCNNSKCDTAVYQDKDEHKCYLFKCKFPDRGNVCIFDAHISYRVSYMMSKTVNSVPGGAHVSHENELENLGSQPVVKVPPTTEEPISTTTVKPGLGEPCRFYGAKCLDPHAECYNRECTCRAGYHEKYGVCQKLCRKEEFECDNRDQGPDARQCVHGSYRCDGNQDCSDGSDEENCPKMDESYKGFPDANIYQKQLYPYPYNNLGYEAPVLTNQQPAQIPANQMYQNQVPAIGNQGGQYYVPGLTNQNQGLGFPQSGSAQINNWPFLDSVRSGQPSQRIEQSLYQNAGQFSNAQNVPYQRGQQQNIASNQGHKVPLNQNPGNNIQQAPIQAPPVISNANQRVVNNNQGKVVGNSQQILTDEAAHIMKPTKFSPVNRPSSVESTGNAGFHYGAEEKGQDQKTMNHPEKHPKGGQFHILDDTNPESDYIDNIDYETIPTGNNRRRPDLGYDMFEEENSDQIPKEDNEKIISPKKEKHPSMVKNNDIVNVDDDAYSRGRFQPDTGDQRHSVKAIHDINIERTYPPTTKSRSQVLKPTQSTIPGQKSGHSSSYASERMEDFPIWMQYESDSQNINAKKGKHGDVNDNRKEEEMKTSGRSRLKPTAATSRPANAKIDKSPVDKTKPASVDRNNDRQYKYNSYDLDDTGHFPSHDYQSKSRDRRPGYGSDVYRDRYRDGYHRGNQDSRYPYYDNPGYRGHDRYHYPVWDSYKEEYYYPDSFDSGKGGNSHRLDYEDYRTDNHHTAGNDETAYREKGPVQSPDHAEKIPPVVKQPPKQTQDTGMTQGASGVKTTDVKIAVTPAPKELTMPPSHHTDDIITTLAPSIDNKDNSGTKNQSPDESPKNSNNSDSKEPKENELTYFSSEDSHKVESYTDSSQGPIVALALGLAITLILLIFVGCRLRTVKRRLRKGRALHSNEADYLINGMYL